MNTSEKRIFKRLLLSSEETTAATFSLPAYSEGLIKACILNLSEGGLGLKFNIRESGIIHEGDQLELEKLNGLEPLKILEGVKAEIRWVLQHKSSRSVRAGCRFVNLSEENREKIREFINDQMDQKIREQDEEFNTGPNTHMA